MCHTAQDVSWGLKKKNQSSLCVVGHDQVLSVSGLLRFLNV